jgi:cell division protease FtsH
VPSNQPPVALRPAKVKEVETEKSVKKASPKKIEKDLSE